jgi:hypothetical protein
MPIIRLLEILVAHAHTAYDIKERQILFTLDHIQIATMTNIPHTTNNITNSTARTATPAMAPLS